MSFPDQDLIHFWLWSYNVSVLLDDSFQSNNFSNSHSKWTQQAHTFTQLQLYKHTVEWHHFWKLCLELGTRPVGLDWVAFWHPLLVSKSAFLTNEQIARKASGSMITGWAGVWCVDDDPAGLTQRLLMFLDCLPRKKMIPCESSLYPESYCWFWPRWANMSDICKQNVHVAPGSIYSTGLNYVLHNTLKIGFCVFLNLVRRWFLKATLPATSYTCKHSYFWKRSENHRSYPWRFKSCEQQAC